MHKFSHKSKTTQKQHKNTPSQSWVGAFEFLVWCPLVFLCFLGDLREGCSTFIRKHGNTRTHDANRCTKLEARNLTRQQPQRQPAREEHKQGWGRAGASKRPTSRQRIREHTRQDQGAAPKAIKTQRQPERTHTSHDFRVVSPVLGTTEPLVYTLGLTLPVLGLAPSSIEFPRSCSWVGLCCEKG